MVYYVTHYVVDWDKVETLEDLKLIMEAIHVAFDPDHPNLPKIKHLTKHVCKQDGKEVIPYKKKEE